MKVSHVCVALTLATLPAIALVGCPARLRLGSGDGGAEAACTAPSECPPGEACDLGTGLCSTSCEDGGVCNGGCCNGTTCVVGNTPSTCGASGGLCAVCSGDTPTCANGQCTGSCGGAGRACGPGFCCGADGGCVAAQATACGSGGACVDCTTSPAGQVCVAGACGCAVATDCPHFSACNTNTGQCSSTCLLGPTTACNGGCCDMKSNTCNHGGLAATCGTTGGVCMSCTNHCTGGPRCSMGACACYGPDVILNQQCVTACGSPTAYCEIDAGLTVGHCVP
jgi:hypothetical protein